MEPLFNQINLNRTNFHWNISNRLLFV